MAKYRVIIGGQEYEVEAPTEEEAVRRASSPARSARPAGPAVTTPSSPPEAAPASSTAAAPELWRTGLATAIRLGTGLIPVPVVSSIAGAAGEAGAQLLEEGRISSPAQIGLAAAIPPAVGAGLRAARAVGRTAVRMSPSLFERAHGAAREALEEITEPLAVEASRASRLFTRAEQLGGRIPLRETAETIADLSRRIPSEPASRGAQAMQRALASARTVLSEGGTADLMRFEAVRRDLGALIRETGSPEAKALYNALLRDLEQAATSGITRPVVRVGPGGAQQVGTRTQPVPGAKVLQRALEAARSERALLELEDIISRATKVRAVSGNDVPVLQVAKFKEALLQPETRKTLEQFGGPEVVRALEAFAERFRTLPPDIAFNAWNRMVFTLGGGAAGVGAGVATGDPIAGAAGVVAGALAPEFLTNLRAVGANPERLNRLLTVIAQTTRGAAASVMSERARRSAEASTSAR